MTVDEYDFVVVGAGSTGCVLADRLTRDRRHSVLLLEAGPQDSHPYIRLPIGYGRLFYRIAPRLNYQEPSLAAQAFDFARLPAEVFPRSARAQYALALPAHDRKETGLFEEASE